MQSSPSCSILPSSGESLHVHAKRREETVAASCVLDCPGGAGTERECAHGLARWVAAEQALGKEHRAARHEAGRRDGCGNARNCLTLDLQRPRAGRLAVEPDLDCVITNG